MPWFLWLPVIWVAFWAVAVWIPLRMQVCVRYSGHLRVQAEVAWLAARLRREWRRPAEAHEETLERLVSRAQRRGTLGWLSGWRQRFRPLLAAGGPITRWLLPRLFVQRLELDLQVGSRDPMAAVLACGGAWAVLGSAMALLQARVAVAPERVHLQIHPSCDRPHWRLRSAVAVRVRPADLLWAGVMFWRRGGLRALRKMRRAETRPEAFVPQPAAENAEGPLITR